MKLWPFSQAASGDVAAKASAVGRAISMHALGRAVWTPRDYQQLAKASYQVNPVAARCISMIANAAANVPILTFEGDIEMSEHPFIKLLKRPNPFTSQRDFLIDLFSFWLVSGNCYIEAVELDRRIRELFILRPDRMKVVPGPRGYPEAYKYTVGHSTVTFSIDPTGQMQILHLKMFHPTDDWYGMAPVESAAQSIDIHNEASSFNKALLQNGARPTGALVYETDDGSLLTPEQFERLKTELEENHQGARNAGRPMLLEGGLKWESMGSTPRELEFIEAKREAARDIALSFGVPPQLLGIPGDNTYTNFVEANRAFYRQAIIPLVQRLLDSMAAWLAPTYGENFHLMPDLDALDALSGERKDLWERVNQSKFLTVDEKREAVGYDPYKPGEGIGARIYAPLNEAPLSVSDKPQQGDAPADGDPFEEDPQE